MKSISTQTVTIASGTTTAEIDCRGRTLYAVQCPASIASTTLTFTGAPSSGGTSVAVNDDAGAAISITVAASKFITLINKHMALRAIPFLTLVFGSSETAKTFTLYFVDE